MTRVQLKFELRMPRCFAIDAAAYYQEAMEQIAALDGLVDYVNFCEHHGTDDGYLPSPLALMAGAATRTRHMRLRGNVVLPFNPLLRLAEDAAVIDILSGGRVELVLLGGYVPGEFAMFGAAPAQRGALMEHGVRTLRAAWSGDTFDYEGRPVRISPRPLQSGGPPLFLGGGVPAAARRAARIGDGFVPMIPQVVRHYEDECRRLGKTPRNEGKIGPVFLHISRDPALDWLRIAPHALYQANAYHRWQQQMNTPGLFSEITDVEQLRRHGAFAVLTPEQCLELAESLGDEGTLVLDPLMGGMPPRLGWESLGLFIDEVAPHLKRRAAFSRGQDDAAQPQRDLA